MHVRRAVVAGLLAVVVAAGWSILAEAQRLPLFPITRGGQTVTPAYEGWYPNPDGTFTLSFGYFNRNSEQVVDIPVGSNNFIEPAEFDGGQPTRFETRRHWGVFTVTVPADFEETQVVWTLVNQEQTFAIPGHLHRDWLIDARYDPANDNEPPVLKFDPAGPEGTAPDGITIGPLTSTVGEPLTLNVWARDEAGEAPTFSLPGFRPVPLALAWFKHQGPGEVTFSEPAHEFEDASGGHATTTVTFSAPGDYIVRVRANDIRGVVSAGHAQCCWTNGFVKVTVSE